MPDDAKGGDPAPVARFRAYVEKTPHDYMSRDMLTAWDVVVESRDAWQTMARAAEGENGKMRQTIREQADKLNMYHNAMHPLHERDCVKCDVIRTLWEAIQ